MALDRSQKTWTVLGVVVVLVILSFLDPCLFQKMKGLMWRWKDGVEEGGERVRFEEGLLLRRRWRWRERPRAVRDQVRAKRPKSVW